MKFSFNIHMHEYVLKSIKMGAQKQRSESRLLKSFTHIDFNKIRAFKGMLFGASKFF